MACETCGRPDGQDHDLSAHRVTGTLTIALPPLTLEQLLRQAGRGA
jgi:hypothetical protein